MLGSYDQSAQPCHANGLNKLRRRVFLQGLWELSGISRVVIWYPVFLKTVPLASCVPGIDRWCSFKECTLKEPYIDEWSIEVPTLRLRYGH